MEKRLNRAFLIIAITVIAVLVAGHFVAPWLGFMIGVAGVLALVAALDNVQGNFLPLAVLFVIVLIVIAMLLGLIAVVMHR